MNHDLCIENGKNCHPLTMEDPSTHEIRVIAWQHSTWRLVLEDMLTGERQELDPLIAMADGSCLKLKYAPENWNRYPLWSPDDDG